MTHRDYAMSFLFIARKEIIMERKLLHNHQYHVAVKSLEEIDTLVKLLKVRGYKIHHNLENILNFTKLPVGLCIDNGFDFKNGGKCVFTTNVTCMACYCAWSKRKPLYVHEIIDNIDKLIDRPDIKFYNDLLDKTYLEKNRPSGGLLFVKDIKK